MTIAYVVAHAAWAPGRKQGLSRVLEAIPSATVLASKRPEHASVWATRLWDWCAAQDAEYVVCLNDDVQPHPQLERIMPAILEAVGPRLLSLFSHNPYAVPLRDAGHHWYQSYWLTGPIYSNSPAGFASMLEWVDYAPRSLVRNINEDNWGIHYAWDRQEAIWTTIPGLATHDTAIPSTLGYDHHANRNSHVPFSDCKDDLTDPAYWRVTGDVPWVPNPWMGEGAMNAVRRMVKAGVEVCEFCAVEPSVAKSGTGRHIGQKCIANLGNALNNAMRAAKMKGAK